MKDLVLHFVLLVSFVSISCGSFDYTISNTYNYGVTLNNQSLLVIGAGALDIDARGFSYIEVQNTAPLQQLVGGIWSMWLDDNSILNYLGGETGGITFQDNAMAIFRGGRIDNISSYQDTDLLKHITFVCDVDSVQYNGNLLTGNWLDGSTFSVILVNQSGYDSVYSNINFVPEPTTMLLLGLGGVLIRRKK